MTKATPPPTYHRENHMAKNRVTLALLKAMVSSRNSKKIKIKRFSLGDVNLGKHSRNNVPFFSAFHLYEDMDLSEITYN